MVTSTPTAQIPAIQRVVTDPSYHPGMENISDTVSRLHKKSLAKAASASDLAILNFLRCEHFTPEELIQSDVFYNADGGKQQLVITHNGKEIRRRVIGDLIKDYTD